MNKSSVARFLVILVLIGAIAAGAVFLGTRYLGGNMGFFGKGGTESKQAGTDNVLKSPSLAGIEKISAVTAKAVNGAVLSPVVFAKTNGGYETVGDMPFGMSSNIRHETVAMKKETLSASKKTPSKFEVRIGGTESIPTPELPQIIEGNVYYSHSDGIVPLDIVIMWPDPAVRNTDKWTGAFTRAGFKESSTNEISNDGKKSRTIKAFEKTGSGARAEVMVERDIVKKTESIGYAALFITSPADSTIRNFLDETVGNLIKDLTKKPLVTAGLKWRQPLAVPEFRKARTNESFSLTTVNFSDRYFPGTSETVIQSSCELWNGVPISYSWVMQKRSWDKIKDQFVKSVLDKDVSDEELAKGALSSDNIQLQVTKAAETGPGAEIIRVSVIDKNTDNKIAMLFDNFGMVNVKELRDSLK